MAVGKLLHSHHTDVDFITRAGKNLVVNCKSYTAANNLVTSSHLPQYNVFVPTIRIHSVGVAYVESEISQEEILAEASCEYPILEMTLESDKLPKEVYLNYVRLPIEPYMIPVKQCFRCFSFGHVMNSPCNKTRICRDCGENYHSEDNSRQCPEYLRQKSFKERMSLMREDYFTACKYFPITYIKTNVAKTNLNLSNETIYPSLQTSEKSQSYSKYNTITNNKFSILREIADLEDNTSYRSSPEYSGPKQVTGTGSFRSTKVNTNGTPAYKQLQGKSSNSGNKQAQTPFSSNRNLAPRLNLHEQTKLKAAVREKILEIRKKIQSLEIKTKGQIDEVLMSFLSHDVSSKTKIKSNTPTDKQGKPHNPSSVIKKSSST
ncbi:hypothetical protein J6590_031706 [Homalodisca vitripennis]|nr:hypothetical protein J6590_031706 [Homalodisca vitripennis]